MTTMREQVINELEELAAGQRKLAGMLQSKQASAPSEKDIQEASELRNAITDKLASAGLIDQIDKVACRDSLDQPGGVETLIDQLLDQFQSTKQASASSSESSSTGQLGSPSAVPQQEEAGSRTGNHKYQPLYHC